MKKLKSISRLFLALSIILIIANTHRISALAGGWLNTVKEIEFDTIYSDRLDYTTEHRESGGWPGFSDWYEAYKFTVPEGGGTVTFYAEGTCYGLISTRRIYTVDNTEDNYCRFQLYPKKSSAKNVYIASDSIVLPAGTYYMVAEYSESFVDEYEGENYSFRLSFAPNAATPQIKSLKSGKKSIRVKWYKSANADGYYVAYNTKKNLSKAKFVQIPNGKAGSKKIKNLKSKKKYYVWVAAYNTVTVDGKETEYLSNWSTPKRVKVK